MDDTIEIHFTKEEVNTLAYMIESFMWNNPFTNSIEVVIEERIKAAKEMMDGSSD